jgi:glycine/D-amino acid oxidase-like deaminating enzyme
VQFTHHWGGPISATLDLVPAIGRIGPNMYYSLGCMGHGVALTQLNGRTVADLVLETPSDLTETWFVNRNVLPIPPEPLRFPLIQGIRNVLRALDAWDGLKAGSPRATAKSSPSRN